MSKAYLITIVTIIVASTIILTAVMGFSQAARASDKMEEAKACITATTDANSLAKLTDEESQSVAFAAGRVLHHVDAARQALADNMKENTLRHIDQGLKLVQIIENAVPKHKVTTDIKSGDLSYHDEEDVSQRYVAIYDEQHVEDIITPVVQAKKEIGDSQNPEVMKAADAGKNKKVSSENVPLVDFSMYQHTSMKLDVVLTRRMLEAAKVDLNDGKNDYADDDLLVVQTDGISVSTCSVELPLVEAADNLVLAQIQVKDGLHEEALVTLKLASDDFKKYEKLAGESRAKEVRKLHQEIDKLTKNLEGEKDLKTAIEKTEELIKSWWDTAVSWFRK